VHTSPLILMVDDEPAIADAVSFALQAEGACRNRLSFLAWWMLRPQARAWPTLHWPLRICGALCVAWYLQHAKKRVGHNCRARRISGS
jgi:hypothetical protein